MLLIDLIVKFSVIARSGSSSSYMSPCAAI